MWDTVLLMAVAAGLGLQRVAAVVIMMSRAEPVRLLLAFWSSGVGMTIAVGGAILLVFSYTGLGQSNHLFSWIEIVAGVAALLLAVLVGSGLATRLFRFARAAAGWRRGRVALPGFGRMPKLVQAGLKTESPWIAGLAGVWFGLPSLYMIASIAAVLDAGVGAEVQFVALVVFSLVAFVQTLVPLVGLLTVPDATRAGLDWFYAWLKARQRLAVTVLSALTGTYLVIKGITRV